MSKSILNKKVTKNKKGDRCKVEGEIVLTKPTMFTHQSALLLNPWMKGFYPVSTITVKPGARVKYTMYETAHGNYHILTYVKKKGKEEHVYTTTKRTDKKGNVVSGNFTH